MTSTTAALAALRELEAAGCSAPWSADGAHVGLADGDLVCSCHCPPGGPESRWASRNQNARLIAAARNALPALIAAAEALAAVVAADGDPPNYSMHAGSCRRQPGACTCHMKQAYAALSALGEAVRL